MDKVNVRGNRKSTIHENYEYYYDPQYPPVNGTNKIPKDSGGQEGLGHANIEPTNDTSGMMHGELYEMEEKFVIKLDEIYGHPDEYQRKVMRFNRHDFLMINGFTYIAKPEKTAKGLKPNKAMMKVYRKSKKLFPMLYFSRLMGTPTID